MLILALIIILLCLNKHRKGSRFGHDSLVDGMLKDGLWDVYNNFSMGMCAEVCADHHSITREEQVLRERHDKLGIAAVCNGGGGASALVFELV
ncbi:hypothetical protein BHE74_00005718 [Ensete ventricosum]|nr:hypothetical protein GW17_00010063 [Ensete ventricosum]RWW85586.1 hypothetical protein BHE74_00005718 [Ensete ventricosum]